MPDWNDFAPRMALVYDLMGNGRTALKYSLNRYNLSRTTGIAANYNPLLSADGDPAVARRQRQRQADGALRCTGYPSAACEIDFTGLSQNFGIAALNEYGEYPAHLEPRAGRRSAARAVRRPVAVSGAWWKGDFRNLTTTVDRAWTHADYVPYTLYNPTTGQPFEVYARTGDPRPTSNLDTYDPERENKYESFVLGRPVAHSRRRPVERRHVVRARTRRRPAPRLTTRTTDGNAAFQGAALRRLRPRHSRTARSSSCRARRKSAGASTSPCRSRTTPARPARAS